jgi:hypothetical protein
MSGNDVLSTAGGDEDTLAVNMDDGMENRADGKNPGSRIGEFRDFSYREKHYNIFLTTGRIVSFPEGELSCDSSAFSDSSGNPEQAHGPAEHVLNVPTGISGGTQYSQESTVLQAAIQWLRPGSVMRCPAETVTRT